MYPVLEAASSTKEDYLEKKDNFPLTIKVLKDAYLSEMIAHKHYIAYAQKAIDENYHNIAYLFTSFAVSEKIHADNFERILTALHAVIKDRQFKLSVSGTKANIRRAAKNELEKIKMTYPKFLNTLKEESHDQAIINSMYAWKSHRQHEELINKLKKYSGIFFGRVAKKIEGMELDFHVCMNCGSTINEIPESTCVICNYPVSYYRRIERPA